MSDAAIIQSSLQVLESLAQSGPEFCYVRRDLRSRAGFLEPVKDGTSAR